MKPAPKRHLRRLAAAALLPALLAACGGGYDDDVVYYPDTCSVSDQKAWLGAYMNDWYFWYKISPHPDASVYSSVDAYFNALLYTGTDVNFPADRWSYTQSTEAFNRFYGDGQTLGYGVSVAGVEVAGQPDQPLYVRYVEPLSSAATQGVVRGDQVVSINGVPSATIIGSDDYSALTPSSSGQQLTLVLRNAGGDRTVTLTASIFSLSPVSTGTVVTSPLGRKMGYVVVKDMISQALAPLETAFAQFKAAGVADVVLDLRYNGGGLVSVGSTVASYVAGSRGSGHAYATLLFNDKRASAYNQSYLFGNLVSAAGVSRVFVLTGPRTCSASEQVINGLRGIGVEVVAIGDTTCGKPVGFTPASACGTTYSAVNFESVNDINQGRYFDGFAPTCAVAEDFAKPLGTPTEPLLGAARGYADQGSCPLSTPSARAMSAQRRAAAVRSSEPDGPRGMIAR